MKILVCFKVLPNPDGILDEDWENFSLTSDISYAGLDYNCFDASALEIGLKLKEQAAVQGAGVSCTALSVCSKITPKFAQSLYSVGFDDVIALSLQNREFKSREVARLISDYAKKIGADIVLTGAQAGFAETGLVPYYISEFLNYPMLANIETASFGDDCLICLCRENTALIEKKVDCPLVLCVNNSPEVLRFATLKARMACRTKQAETIIAEDADESLFNPTLIRPKSGRVCEMLEKDSEESAEKVLEILKKYSTDESESKQMAQGKESWEKFLKEKAVFVKSNCFCGEDKNELLKLYEKLDKKLIVLPDSQEGRALAVFLSEKKGLDIFINAKIEDIKPDSIDVKKHVCGANLEWKKTLNCPCVITVQKSEEEKLKSINEALLDSSSCDKVKCIKSERVIEKPQPTSLDFAPLVIACGAGMGSKEAFDRARILAQKLNAGFGLTRPSALNAWGSPTEIIGQSGSIISPKCVLVLGAAGAGAFMLGIENSKKIIAVNTDCNALIFKNSDIGIECDANNFVEKLISLLERED